MDLNQKAREALKEMFDMVDAVSIDDIKTKGFTIRSGNKLLKLQVVEELQLPVEDEIREEFRQKLREKMQEIKSRLNSKITEMVELTSRVKQEAETKERELKDKLSKAHPMPDITENHAKRGISVVKGPGTDELIWLIQGIYWPKTYDRHPIEPNYSKKMMSPVTFMIRTYKNQVKGLSTRKTIGLGYFDHYHQINPDCWGNYKWPSTWEKIDDLIKIAKDAEAVLENVNPNSIARENPSGLPRKSTLERHVIYDKKSVNTGPLDQAARRLGANNPNEDVWEIS